VTVLILLLGDGDTWMWSVSPVLATQMTSTQRHHSWVGWTLSFISRWNIKCLWNIRPEEKCYKWV